MDDQHTSEHAKIESLMARLQRRYGTDALRRGLQPPSHAGLHPSFGPVGRLLPGGLPVGAITEVVGTPTSGAYTLTLDLLRSAQSAEQAAVLVDPTATFDPLYAQQVGVDLETLVIAHPTGDDELARIALDMAAADLSGLIVLDLGFASKPFAASRRVAAALRGTSTTLVALSPAEPTNLVPGAALRLLVEWQAWLPGEEPGMGGWQSRVTVLKAARGKPGEQAVLTFQPGPDA